MVYEIVVSLRLFGKWCAVFLADLGSATLIATLGLEAEAIAPDRTVHGALFKQGVKRRSASKHTFQTGVQSCVIEKAGLIRSSPSRISLMNQLPAESLQVWLYKFRVQGSAHFHNDRRAVAALARKLTI